MDFINAILSLNGPKSTKEVVEISLTRLSSIGLQSRPTAVAFNTVQSLFAFSLDSNHLCVVGGGWECVLDPPLGVTRDAVIQVLRFRSGDKQIVALNSAGDAVIWTLGSNDTRLVRVIGDAVTLHISDSSWMAFGSSQGTVHLVDVVTTQVSDYTVPVLSDASLSNNSIARLAFCPTDCNLLLVCYCSGCIAIWDISQRKFLRSFVYRINEASEPLSCCFACWRPDGEQIVATYSNNLLVFWNTKDDWKLSIGMRKEESRKPMLVRHVSNDLTIAAAAKKTLASLELRPITYLDWVSLDDDESVLVIGGGNSVDSDDAVTCLRFTAKFDYKPSSIRQTVIPTKRSLKDCCCIAPYSSTPGSFAIVTLLTNASISAHLVSNDQVSELLMPGSFFFDASSFAASKSIMTTVTCTENKFTEYSNYTSTNQPQFLSLNGGSVSKRNSKRITDLLCVVRDTKCVEFWHASTPLPTFLFATQCEAWLPPIPITNISVDTANDLLVIQLGVHLVLHDFVTNVVDDVSAMMDQLDAAIGQVLDDSQAINDLINSSEDPDDIPPRLSSKSQESALAPQDKALDEQKFNEHVVVTFMNGDNVPSSSAWRPRFQATFSDTPDIIEISNTQALVAAAMQGEVVVFQLGSGREILLDSLTEKHPTQQPSRATALKFTRLLNGDDPIPEFSLLVATDAWILYSYVLLKDATTLRIQLKRHVYHKLQPPQNDSADVPIHVILLTQDGVSVTSERKYSPKEISEQYCVIVGRRSIVVLVREGTKALSVLVRIRIPWSDEKILVVNIAYILNGTKKIAIILFNVLNHNSINSL